MNPPPEELLFQLALTKTIAERALFLDRECGDDKALRARLEALLAAHEQPATELAGADAAASTVKAAAIMEQPDEAVGQTLGRYKLLERVGEGGCGVVYVAEQTAPVRRRVALKVIKLGMDTKQVVARFEAERQALALMDHPNIAKVLDAGTTDMGRPYFVMELVRGIRITDYCDQANLCTQDRLDLFIKVCQAIQHAHQKGIIHRDIKPSNILVTLHDGVPVPKVIDFGIAKATEGRLTDNTVYTQLHQFIGTPAYMSPEQAEMSGLDIDTRSDIYSLGVLLYELLTGSTPFDAKELMASGIDAMRKTIREKEPVRPSTRLTQELARMGSARGPRAESGVAPDSRSSISSSRKGSQLNEGFGGTPQRARETRALPEHLRTLINALRGDLDWIVMKCLEKDRTRRYETASGLAADIKRHLNHEPVLARPPSAAYRFQRALRRNRLAFTAAVAVAAALLAGIGLSMWQAWEARQAQRTAEAAQTSERQQRLEAQTAQRAADAERERADAEARKAVANALQARRLLYVADVKLAQQALEQNNLGRARQLLERHRPRPDEEDFRGFEWRYLWQECRGEEQRVFTNHAATVSEIIALPDGRHIATSSRDGVLRLWNTKTWTSREVARLEGPIEKTALALSPDGTRLAVCDDTQIILLRTGDWREIWSTPARGVSFTFTRPVVFSPDGDAIVITDGPLVPRPRIEGLRVIDAATGHENRTLPPAGEIDLTSGLAFSREGRLLCFSTTNLLTRDFVSGETLAVATNIRSDRVAVSPDGHFIACGDQEGGLGLLNTLTGALTFTQAHASLTWGLAFSPDGKQLATGGGDQLIHVWSVPDLEKLRTLRGHEDEVWALAFTTDGRTLVSGGKDRTVRLWDLSSPAAAVRVRALPDARGRLQVAGDSVLWLGTRRGGAQAWKVQHGELRPQPELAATIPENTADLSADGQVLLLREGRGLFRVVDAGGNVRAAITTAPGGAIPMLSSGGRWAAFFTPQSVTIFDAATGGELFATARRISTRAAPAFSPDDERLAFARDATTLAVVEISSGQSREIRASDEWQITQVAFSPDGSTIAAALLDGSVRLYGIRDGNERAVLRGHRHGVYHVQFSPDGRTLASWSDEGVLRLWNVATAQEVLSLPVPRLEQLHFAGRGAALAFLAEAPSGQPELHWLAAPELLREEQAKP